jgi:aryl-alcohol dehydrogenase-like predicted oxidoreductase
MQYRQLHRSGLAVSELTLGAMVFGEENQRGTPPEEAERMIHRYLDAGGNHIDTANGYADGRSGEIESEIVDLCLSEGVGITPLGHLGGGALTGNYHPAKHPREGRIATSSEKVEEIRKRRNLEQNWIILDKVTSLASIHNASASQVSIPWLLAQPAITSVIIAVRTMEQLEDNPGGENVRLQPDEIAELNQASAREEGYPYRCLNQYGESKTM